MGYELRGVIAAVDVARVIGHAFAEAPVALGHDIALVPFTDDAFDRLTGQRVGGRLDESFAYYSAGLDSLVSDASSTERAVYVEAELFGGSGSQAAGWERGEFTARAAEDRVRLATTGRGDAPGLAINKALRWLGVVRAGFSTDHHYPLERYEEQVAATGLVPEARFATWVREPWEPGRDYAVSVHRRPDR